MLVSTAFTFVASAFVIVTCQQPLDDLSEISPYQPTGNLERSLLQQCESFAQTITEENERLKNEIKVLRMKVEALEEIAEEEDNDEEEEKDGSDESKEPSKSLRSRRAAAGCEGGTLAAWACAPQCVFKLKGLCGLSLKSIYLFTTEGKFGKKCFVHEYSLRGGTSKEKRKALPYYPSAVLVSVIQMGVLIATQGHPALDKEPGTERGQNYPKDNKT